METTQRKYSVIVVTYNNADGLRRTLKSIRLLDYAQKEVVVIDGGSMDETLNVIAENQDIITISVSEKDNGIYHQAVYYRREVLQKYGFDESYKLIADLKSVVEPLVKDRITISCIMQPLAICESGGLSKQRWRDTLTENRRLIDETVDPLYKDDYLKMARINNSMIDYFIVLSYFPKTFLPLRWLAKTVRFLNGKFKHIPIE